MLLPAAAMICVGDMAQDQSSNRMPCIARVSRARSLRPLETSQRPCPLECVRQGQCVQDAGALPTDASASIMRSTSPGETDSTASLSSSFDTLTRAVCCLDGGRRLQSSPSSCLSSTSASLISESQAEKRGATTNKKPTDANDVDAPPRLGKTSMLARIQDVDRHLIITHRAKTIRDFDKQGTLVERSEPEHVLQNETTRTVPHNV